MIDSIDSLSPTISKEWIGLILLPAVGSLAGTSILFNLPKIFLDLVVSDRMYHGRQRLGKGSIDFECERSSGIDHRKLILHLYFRS